MGTGKTALRSICSESSSGPYTSCSLDNESQVRLARSHAESEIHDDRSEHLHSQSHLMSVDTVPPQIDVGIQNYVDRGLLAPAKEDNPLKAMLATIHIKAVLNLPTRGFLRSFFMVISPGFRMSMEFHHRHRVWGKCVFESGTDAQSVLDGNDLGRLLDGVGLVRFSGQLDCLAVGVERNATRNFSFSL